MQDRQIRLEMDGRTGDEHDIESGIGPILFTVYISEMLRVY